MVCGTKPMAIEWAMRASTRRTAILGREVGHVLSEDVPWMVRLAAVVCVVEELRMCFAMTIASERAAHALAERLLRRGCLHHQAQLPAPHQHASVRGP